MRKLLSMLFLAGCVLAATGTASAADRVDPANFARLVPGKTTQAEARELLGQPDTDMWLRREQRQTWGYKYRGTFESREFWLEWRSDGVLHSASDAPDFDAGRYRSP